MSFVIVVFFVIFIVFIIIIILVMLKEDCFGGIFALTQSYSTRC